MLRFVDFLADWGFTLVAQGRRGGNKLLLNEVNQGFAQASSRTEDKERQMDSRQKKAME